MKVGNASAFMHDVWSIPLQLAIGSYMLYGYLRLAGLVGVGVMCLVLPCNLLISRKLKGFNERLMKARDKRVDFTNEVLLGVKALKLHAWEPLLMKQVEQKRVAELRELRGHQLWLAAIIFCLNALPTLVTAISFILYSTLIAPDQHLSPTIAFPSLIVFNIITFPLLILPFVLNAVVDVATSNKRLSNFLNAPSRPVIDLDATPSSASSLASNSDGGASPLPSFDGHFTSAEPAPPGGYAIEVHAISIRSPPPLPRLPAARPLSCIS